MSDIELITLRARILASGSTFQLIEAAAGVANALSVGAGSFIAGSLMEQELRDALRLKTGELVNVPKQVNGTAPHD